MIEVDDTLLDMIERDALESSGAGKCYRIRCDENGVDQLEDATGRYVVCVYYNRHVMEIGKDVHDCAAEVRRLFADDGHHVAAFRFIEDESDPNGFVVAVRTSDGDRVNAIFWRVVGRRAERGGLIPQGKINN